MADLELRALVAPYTVYYKSKFEPAGGLLPLSHVSRVVAGADAQSSEHLCPLSLRRTRRTYGWSRSGGRGSCGSVGYAAGKRWCAARGVAAREGIPARLPLEQVLTACASTAERCDGFFFFKEPRPPGFSPFPPPAALRS